LHLNHHQGVLTLSLLSYRDDAVNQGSAITIAGVETINILTSDDDADTYELKTLDTLVAAAADKIVVTGDSSITLSGSTTATLNEIDASGMTIANVSTASTTAGLTYATGTTGNTTAGDTLKITGSNGQDALTGHADIDDTFLGGLGIDTLTYNGRKDTFTGGAGNDSFVIGAIEDATDLTGNFLTITDLTAGDTIDIAAVDSGTATWNATELTLGANATFANYLTNAAAGNGGTNSIMRWFQFGGNTYMVNDNTASTTAFTTATDTFWKISGEVELKNSTLSGTTLTIV
jgi:S-layer protein